MILSGVERFHCLFLIPLVLGKMYLSHAKLGGLLFYLDTLLQKNVIVFFFANQISKWRSFEKRAIFDVLFTFFSHQGKLQKLLQYISPSHTYMYFAHPFFFFFFFFCLTNFEKKNTNLSGMVSLWYHS